MENKGLTHTVLCFIILLLKIYLVVKSDKNIQWTRCMCCQWMLAARSGGCAGGWVGTKASSAHRRRILNNLYVVKNKTLIDCCRSASPSQLHHRAEALWWMGLSCPAIGFRFKHLRTGFRISAIRALCITSDHIKETNRSQSKVCF
jgi:hypothetical protein